MLFKIDLPKLREGDTTLDLDNDPRDLELDGEEWTFKGRITGSVKFHMPESDQSDVYARGTVCAQAVGECVRCLAPVTVEVEERFRYIYMPVENEPTDDVAVDHVSKDAPEPAYYSGDSLDPAPQIRETILLGLPDLPHCPECEARRDEPVHMEDFPAAGAEADEPDWKRKLRSLGAG